MAPHDSEIEMKIRDDQTGESETRLAMLARATTDAIWDRDIASDRVWWSEGMRTLFGFVPEEMGVRPERMVGAHP